MKRFLLMMVCAIGVCAMWAQVPVLAIQTSEKTHYFQIAEIDSIQFSASADYMYVNYDEDKQKQFASADIIQMTYTNLSAAQDISIVWNNDGTVSVTNSMSDNGVDIAVAGADVVITAVYPDEVTYKLSGTSSDGSLRIYSDYKYELVLNGLTLTNPAGPAINSQSKKKGTIKMQKGTVNTLTDGTTYADSDEDQKGCLFSEGQLVFKGSGTLTVNANYKHGIASDDYIEIENGTINVTTTAAAAKAFKANDYISVLDEGNSPIITITQSGNKVIADGDVSYCAAMKADSTITIACGTLTVNSSAEGGKGLNADQGVIITGGTLNISLTGSGGTYSQKAVDATATGGTTPSGSTTYTVYFYAAASQGGGGGYPGGGGSSQWTNVQLYKADGTLVSTLSTKQVSDYTAYYYTFPQGTTGNYYFTGTYQSRQSSYSCKTSTFAAPTTADAYYRPGTYTTSGSTRTYTLTTWDPNSYQPGGGGGGGGSTDTDTQTFTCTCIKSDGYISILGGTLTLSATGTKGTVGIKCDGDLTIGVEGAAGPNLNITTTGTYITQTGSGMDASYAGDPKGAKAEGNVYMYSGEVYISTSGTAGEGLECKSTMTLAGGKIYAYSKCDDAINCAGAINCSGAWVYAVSDGNDAVDSNYGRSGAISISGGVVVALSSKGSPEEGLDCDNNSYIKISGGYVFSGGAAQGGGGGSSSVGSATQAYCFTGSYAINKNTYYTVYNNAGTALFTIKALTSISSNNNSLSLISAPALTKSSTNSIKSGSAAPTDATAWDGYIYVGGTSSASTSVKTFTGK